MTHSQFVFYYSPKVVVRCGQVGTEWRSGYWWRRCCRTTTNPLAWERFIQEFMYSQLHCVEMASQITAETEIIWFIVWLVLSFYAPKHWLPNAPQWNNCLYLPLSTSQNKLLMRKCDRECCLVTALSHVHCHTGSPSHVAMPSHNIQTSWNKYLTH
jgi:hypothetical protein